MRAVGGVAFDTFFADGPPSTFVFTRGVVNPIWGCWRWRCDPPGGVGAFDGPSCERCNAPSNPSHRDKLWHKTSFMMIMIVSVLVVLLSE